MPQQKIRIRLKGYDHQQVDKSARDIVDTAQRTGATITGPVPLPTEKNVYCVIRSPFKDKDSREHFEVRTHKRLIDIHSPTPKTVDSLMRLDLPAGVDIEIKLMTLTFLASRTLGTAANRRRGVLSRIRSLRPRMLLRPCAARFSPSESTICSGGEL